MGRKSLCSLAQQSCSRETIIRRPSRLAEIISWHPLKQEVHGPVTSTGFYWTSRSMNEEVDLKKETYLNCSTISIHQGSTHTEVTRTVAPFILPVLISPVGGRNWNIVHRCLILFVGKGTSRTRRRINHNLAVVWHIEMQREMFEELLQMDDRGQGKVMTGFIGEEETRGTTKNAKVWSHMPSIQCQIFRTRTRILIQNISDDKNQVFHLLLTKESSATGSVWLKSIKLNSGTFQDDYQLPNIPSLIWQITESLWKPGRHLWFNLSVCYHCPRSLSSPSTIFPILAAGL